MSPISFLNFHMAYNLSFQIWQAGCVKVYRNPLFSGTKPQSIKSEKWSVHQFPTIRDAPSFSAEKLLHLNFLKLLLINLSDWAIAQFSTFAPSPGKLRWIISSVISCAAADLLVGDCFPDFNGLTFEAFAFDGDLDC